MNHGFLNIYLNSLEKTNIKNLSSSSAVFSTETLQLFSHFFPSIHKLKAVRGGIKTINKHEGNGANENPVIKTMEMFCLRLRSSKDASLRLRHVCRRGREREACKGSGKS